MGHGGSFVVHGALDEALIFATCQEMYFQFEKIQPYLAGFREQMKLPEFLRSMETVVTGSQERRTRAVAKTKKVRSPSPEPDESTPAAEPSTAR